MRTTLLLVLMMCAGLVGIVSAVRPAFACKPYSLSNTVPSGYLYCTRWAPLKIVYINGIPHRQYVRKCTYKYPGGGTSTNTFYTYCDIR